MSTYNPESLESRATLAHEMFDRLERGGFVRVFPPGTSERVYEKRSVRDNTLAVRVYTSCTDRYGARERGTDAIRVALVYHCADGKIRGLAKEPRVHRTGEISGIVNRIVGRITEIRDLVPTLQYCACGAPKFLAKTGNMVCSEICWTKRSVAA